MSKRCMGCMEVFDNEFEVCSKCGYLYEAKPEEAIHIEPGSLIGDRYIIGKVLGYGGFGVTYIGWDGKLEQRVAIKEYLPSEFSTRMPGEPSLTVFGGDKTTQFNDGMNKFVEEAKHLAKFQNEEGIVKIFDSFFENNTAYIVMEYLEGETLGELLKRIKTIPEDDAVKMLTPIMNSLKVIHKEGLLHRDIAPDNIFITKSGEVKLIDFGASRFATTSHSRSLTVVIKPGYSPEEQYRSRGDQGPHTDVYAIAATLYKMITGKTPPDAMERRAKIENQRKEILTEPHKLNKEISRNRENAILNAMNVRIEDRTANIEAFMDELSQDPPAKRRYGSIKKIDIYALPRWLKATVASVLCVCIVLGTLLATGVIDFPSLFSDNVDVPEGMVVVPNIEKLSKDEALEVIEESNLTPVPDGNVESEYVDADKIVYQTPAAGSYLSENAQVTITVSSGKGVEEAKDGIATVPYVVWDTKENAIKKLKKAGLGEPTVKYKEDENVPKGSVISQSVKSGKKVKVKTKITIVVSKGSSQKITVPSVVAKSEYTASKTLKDEGLSVTVEYQKSEIVSAGNVISQNIQPGNKVKKGTEVTIIVASSDSTITVKDVVNKSEDSAKKILDGQGFKVSITKSYSNDVKEGYVISQSPKAGSKLIKNSTVTVCVSKGKQPSSSTTSSTSSKPTSSKENTSSEVKISDWVEESQAPKNAKITDTMWKYTETVDSTWSSSTSLDGWTKTGKWKWEPTGTTGTQLYANFSKITNRPNAPRVEFYTNNEYYKNYNNKPYEEKVTETYKRKVKTDEYTNIYWHWNDTDPKAQHGSYDRPIGNYYGEVISGRSHTHFAAFEKSQLLPNTDQNGKTLPEFYHVRDNTNEVSWWWNRTIVYKQTYIDYEKQYYYEKKTERTSQTAVSNGGNISNVKKLVRYVIE